MLSFRALFIDLGPSVLPALLLLTVVIVVQRKGRFGWKKHLVYGLALSQLALPALMGTSAVLFSHDRGVIRVNRPTEAGLSYLLLGLYLLQLPVGFLLAVLLTSRIRVTKYQVMTATSLAVLLYIQMYYSSILMIQASLEITGDSF